MTREEEKLQDNRMRSFAPDDVYLAPLAGYTDLPFRRACRDQGLKLGFTALIDAGALVYGNSDNGCILERGHDESWLGVQLLGSRLDLLEKAGPMLACRDFNEFNLNMGCPVRKVVQRGAGAGLLKDCNRAFRCVELLRKLTSGCFSVKLRILCETDMDATVSFCRTLEGLGVERLYLHGRVASRVYAGPVHTEIIRAVRESVSIPVVANGGIFRMADAVKLRQETGCEQVMVARGAIGNPWIFASLLQRKEVAPTHGEFCQALEKYVFGMMESYGEEDGLVTARKSIMGFLGGRGYHRSLKLGVCSMRMREEFSELMKQIRDDREPADVVAVGEP